MTELNILYPRIGLLPAAARAFVHTHDGWVVGSAAKYLLGLVDGTPKDIDILVPFYEWGRACLVIPKGTPSNSFGGFKLEKQQVYYQDANYVFDIDVWAGDIGWFLANSKLFEGYAVQLKTQTILVRHYGLIK